MSKSCTSCTYHLLDHLSCNDCCPIPRCPSICICIGNLFLYFLTALSLQQCSICSIVCLAMLLHFYSPIAHSSRVYSILSEVDGFSFHFFLCSRFKILFSRLKTLFASMLSATAYIAPAALSQNLFDNLRQIIFRNYFCNFTNRFSHSNKYI